MKLFDLHPWGVYECRGFTLVGHRKGNYESVNIPVDKGRDVLTLHGRFGYATLNETELDALIIFEVNGMTLPDCFEHSNALEFDDGAGI